MDGIFRMISPGSDKEKESLFYLLKKYPDKKINFKVNKIA
jgi:hypothetical protein